MHNYSEGSGNQAFVYDFEGLVYGCCISDRQDKLRVAVSTFKEESTNEVFILETNPVSNMFYMRTKFRHKNLVSQLGFVANSELLVTAGERLRVWKYEETTNAVFFQCELVNDQRHSGPISSFDSHGNQPHVICTAQLDSSIAVWDLVKRKASAQFIAHEEEVLDISFSQNQNVFASLGGDRDVCRFDVRQLRKCGLISQNKNLNYLKLSWNKEDGIYIAISESDLGIIDLFDTRITKEPVQRLREHKDFITAIDWLPQLKSTLVSTGDDGKALCWNCVPNQRDIGSESYFNMGKEISNLCISNQKGVVGITSQNQFQILKVIE